MHHIITAVRSHTFSNQLFVTIVWWILLILGLYAILFLQLERISLIMWDEAGVATNALDMYLGGNPFAPTQLGKPDLFNLKPPLVPFIQSLFMRMIPAQHHLLAIRLPSVISVAALCIFIALWMSKRIHNKWAGLAAAMLVASAPIPFLDHSWRTGDYDAMLTAFLIISALIFYIFIKSLRYKYLYLSVVCMVLAVWCKGIAVLPVLVGMFIWLIFNKNANTIFSQTKFYVAIVLGLAFAAAIYLLRDYYHIHYLNIWWQNEVLNLATSNVQGHGEPWWFYLKLMWFHNLYLTSLFLTSTLYLCYLKFYTKGEIPSSILYIVILFSTNLTIISIATTKNEWYATPISVFMAIIITMTLTLAIIKYKSYLNLLFLILSIYPVYMCIKSNLTKSDSIDWDMALIVKYLPRLEEEKPDLKTFTMVHSQINPSYSYYNGYYNHRKQGYHINLQHLDSFSAYNYHGYVVTTEVEPVRRLDTTVGYQIIHQQGWCRVYYHK